MKNSPAIWWLYRRTDRMTDCTAAVSKKDVAAKPLLRTRSTFSHSRWWCQSVYQKWASLVCYSSRMESRWMKLTTVTFCCCNICCRSYVKSPASSSFFSRTVLRRTGLVRRSWTRDSCFHLAGFVTAEQLRPQSDWLQNLRPAAATSLPDESAERERFETASDWRVERNGTMRCCLHACVQAQGGHSEYSLWLANLFNVYCENFFW